MVMLLMMKDVDDDDVDDDVDDDAWIIITCYVMGEC